MDLGKWERGKRKERALYIDGEAGVIKESVVFDGLKRVGLLRGIVEAERKSKSKAMTNAVWNVKPTIIML